MLQQLVANWLRQQATQAVTDALQNAGTASPDDPASSSSTDSQSESELRRQFVCVVPAAAESAGLADRLSDLQVHQCDGFVERCGTLRTGQTISLLECGGKHADLVRALQSVVELRQPEWVISAGFAIGLQAELRRGHFLIADRVTDGEQFALSTGMKMAAAETLHVGTLLTRQARPDSRKAKQQLARDAARHRPLACDTQAAVVAEVCRVLGRRMLCMHVIADTRDTELSTTVRQLQQQQSLAGLLGAATGAILQQPQQAARQMLQNQEATLRLADRLAEFMQAMLLQLD